MSQLANMQAEQASLRQEVHHLDNAEPLDQSAAKLIAFMVENSKNDPLISAPAQDNEWVYNPDDRGGCCEVQ